MASASGIRMGKVFVEIGADASAALAAFGKLNKRIGQIGASMSSFGTKISGIGVAMGVPFIAAARAGAKFEDALLAVKASTGATASEVDKVRAAAMATSQALGVGPTDATKGFLELLKAGMSLESVLGGAGETALQFAQVGQIDVARAGVVMADAMNVFGVSAELATNTLSAAADASSTSIEEMTMAFSQSSAVAALANQSMGDLSAALAVLANNGVKGSDAGTSVKTMLMRLMAPADDAAEALASVGLSAMSFRDASGKMLPMVDIIGTLNGALDGMDQAAKDDIFRRIFGSDAIRAAAILTSTGVDGFNAMRAAMDGALPVGEKYKTLTSGLSGAMAAVWAAVERAAIAVSDAIGPALVDLSKPVVDIIDGFAKFAAENKELVASIAKVAVGLTAAGVAFVGIGMTLSLLSTSVAGFMTAFGGIAAVVGLALSPIGLLVAGVTAAVMLGPQLKGAFSGVLDGLADGAGAVGQVFSGMAADATVVFSDLASTASTTFNGIYEAIADGDLAGAMDVLWAGLKAGWLRGVEAIMGYVDPWISMFQNAFTILGAEIYKTWDGMWTGVSNSFNTVGAVIQGAIDNVINGVLASWDTLEAGIRKSWNYIQSFFTKGFDLEAENNKVTNDMDARARKRELERPGIDARSKEAEEKNAAANKDLEDRKKAVDANTQATIDGREAENRRRADQRRADTQAAEGNLAGKARGKRENRVRNDQFTRLLKDIEGASTLDALRGMYEEFDALSSNGRLTSGQMATLETALEDAQERVSKAAGGMGGSPSQKIADGAGAAAAAGGQAEAAGTFSSVALGGLGVGSSLAQKQLDELRGIHNELKKDSDGLVAA